MAAMGAGYVIDPVKGLPVEQGRHRELEAAFITQCGVTHR